MRTLEQIYSSLNIPPAPMTLPEMVRLIRKDWKKPYFGAVPYLDALEQMASLKDNYFFDDGRTIATYFLANAQTWRGPVAKAVKAEIKRQLGDKS